MAAQRFLAMIAGKLAEVAALAASAGASSAGSIPALNDSGLIDASMLPAATSSVAGAVTRIANVTITIGTTAVAANSAATAQTASMPGLTTSSVIALAPSSDISGVTGWGTTGGLEIVAWPTANTLHYRVVNPTGMSVTPSASVTFNVSAQ